MAMIQVAVNEKGYRIGQDHHKARYSDSEVEMVWKLRDLGWGYKRIAAAVEMPIRTVRAFLSGCTRCQCAVAYKVVKVG